MTTLTIECSSNKGSIALTRDQDLLHAQTFENPRGRGSLLFSVLEETLSLTEKIDQVLVGTGPGSYNALRSSIAAGWGIAKAQGAKLGGLCSLLGYDADEYYVIGDARANQWFFGHVKSGCLVSPVELFAPTEVALRMQKGIKIFSTGAVMEDAIIQSPEACILALRADQAGPAEPFYLKPPHITKSSRPINA